MSNHHPTYSFPHSRQVLAIFAGKFLPTLAACTLGLMACVGPQDDWSGPSQQASQQPGSAGIGTWSDADAVTRCEGTILISEVHPNPLGSDADGTREYIEFTGDAGTSLSGWALRFVNGADGAIYAESDLQGAIPDSGVLVIYGGASVTGASTLPRPLQQGPDSIELLNCHGQVAQRFDYPAAGTGAGELPEGMSVCWCGGTLRACSPTPGDRDDRICDLLDACADACDLDAFEWSADAGIIGDITGSATDDSGWNDPADSPDAWLDGATERCRGSSQQGIRIQEVLFDPSGADSLDAEFVELSVPAGQTTLGLRLVHWDAGAGAEAWSVDLSAMDDSVVLLGGVEGATAALPGMLQNGPDAVWLEDCAGAVLDVVVYGTGEPMLPDWLDLEQQPLIEGRASHSLAACDGGRDSQGWFRGAAAVPSPGAPNSAWVDSTACQPPCAGSAPGSAVIQEVLFNPEGADSGFEFIELAAGGAGLPGGIELRFINGANGEAWAAALVIDSGAEGSGVWVVGGAEVPESQQLLHTTLQNGPDGIQLWSCDGTLLDTVGWGENAGEADWVEGGGFEGARDGCSMTRNTASRDTQDNRRDFVADCTPSPGRR
jgi:hypothetical protein